MQAQEQTIQSFSVHVCTSREEKPKRLPEEMSQKLKPYWIPEPNHIASARD